MVDRNSSRRRRLWWLLVRHAGHTQLLVRCLTAFGHAALSIGLAAQGIDLSHSPFIAFLQLTSSWSLAVQYRTADDLMFVVRACSSLGRCVLLVHAATCGRTWLPNCDARPWTEGDMRLPLRIVHLCGAVRMVLNARSLLLQFADPSRRPSIARGHPQLRKRSFIRATGIPLYAFRAIYKATALRNTRFSRTTYEIAANCVRAFFLIPIDVWSLRRQWQTPPGRMASSSAASMNDLLKIEPPKAHQTRHNLFWVLGHSRQFDDADDDDDGAAPATVEAGAAELNQRRTASSSKLPSFDVDRRDDEGAPVERIPATDDDDDDSCRTSR